MASPIDSCFDGATPLMSVEEAIAAMCEETWTVTRSRMAVLPEAGDRILAEDLVSPIDVPGFDNSAMDGYALRIDDLETARTQGLPVSQRIAAGMAGSALKPGSCARIFTGAPLPDGAYTVVRQEHCRVEGERVYVTDYETTDADLDTAVAEMRSEARKPDNAEFYRWKDRAITLHESMRLYETLAIDNPVPEPKPQ